MKTYNLISNVMLNSASPEPEVGMGATMCGYSDRRAGTIVKVERFKTGKKAGRVRAVYVQRDTATRTDQNGMSDAQSYEYGRDSRGYTACFKATKTGFREGCTYLLVGHRDEFYDYTF